MNQRKIIDTFQKKILQISKQYKNITDMFTQLHIQGYSRLELMIIDSAIKKMSLDNLYITLLLPQNKYYDMLQNLTLKLKTT